LFSGRQGEHTKNQACLWPRPAYLREKLTLSGKTQADLPANKASTPEVKLVSGQVELAQGKSTLSGAKQACLPADKANMPKIKPVSGRVQLIYGKINAIWRDTS
jgi:hypothetical protein